MRRLRNGLFRRRVLRLVIEDVDRCQSSRTDGHAGTLLSTQDHLEKFRSFDELVVEDRNTECRGRLALREINRARSGDVIAVGRGIASDGRDVDARRRVYVPTPQQREGCVGSVLGDRIGRRT